MTLESLKASLADRYRIERELGQGGMATVYLARDARHDRDVAVKVLRPELAAVIGAERFLTEIRTTATLQHPHILPLFDSGEAEGFLFYVMPYVEGESLRDRLARERQLPVADAVRIAGEVASALDYAHRHGVIHRDIKPENVMLHDGQAMVADFGIALALSNTAGTRMTETGMSLGTPHYMSPEQAMGEREITVRSDVYALGAIAYEMLVGEPPFSGPTAQAIVARVMTEDPRPITIQRKSVPPHVEAAVFTALEKLPADRFGSAREFADAIEGRGATIPSGAVRYAGSAPKSLANRPLVLGLAAALLASTGFAAVQWRAAHREVLPDVVRFQLDLLGSMLSTNVALGTNVAVSPDGRKIVYAVVSEAGAPRIFVRGLDEDVGHFLAGTEGAQSPAFSPDGKWIAYLKGSVVWKVEVGGGAPVQVGPTDLAPVGMTWAANGEIFIGTARGLLALRVNGGRSRLVGIPDTTTELYFNQPRVLSDGETVLFAIQPKGGPLRTRLAALSLRTEKITRYDLVGLDPLGYVDGTLVYVSPSGGLSAVPFDLKQGALAGPVGLGPVVATTVSGSSQAAFSPTGTLVYQPREAEATLGWVNAQGEFQPVLSDPQAYAYPRLSPDGRRIAMSIGTGGRSDVWVYDLVSNTPTRLTSADGLNDRPEWTPDGRRILYRTDRGKRTAIWWRQADLSGPEEPLQASDTHDFYEGLVAPDGRTLVYQIDDAVDSQADVMYRLLEGDTTSRAIAATAFAEAQGRVSPDGHWIVYVTDASGIAQVVVAPFPVPGGVVQVSSRGGTEPVWSRDGRRIFYRDGQNMVAATVTTTPGFAVTGRTNLFPDRYVFTQAPHANFDVSPDGSRFLMVKGSGGPQLFVVYGWRDELRARMRGTE